MKIYVDSEFIDDCKTVDLISIGLVAEDGRELYLQSTEFNIDRASQWVRDNVLMHLGVCPHIETHPGYSLGTIYGMQVQHKQGQCTFEEPVKGITGLRMPKMSGFIIGAYADCPWRTREQLRNEVTAFLDTEKYGKPEFIGWCSSYDHVALCQLHGTMMDIPDGWPHYIKDLQFILDEQGITDDMLPQQETGLHNALADAKHIQLLWNTYCKPGER